MSRLETPRLEVERPAPAACERQVDPQSGVVLHDAERRAVAELKAGQAGARAGFERAIAAAGSGVLPLSEQLLAWLVRGYALAAARITDAQRRHGYFVVREGQVDAQRAIPLPSIPASAAAPSSPSSIHRGGVRG